MAGKAAFTSEEWTTLLDSPMMAAIAVTTADPSGLWGTIKESIASARIIMGAKHDASELVRTISAAFETSEGRATTREGLRSQLSGKRPAEITAKCLEGLKLAAAIASAKTPEEFAAFTFWLRHIAQAVAEASKEGGFLGFGGAPVSDAEKATLAHIDESLGVPPS